MSKVLRINTAWCKGCAICAVFCPRKALEMQKEKAVLRDADACVKCVLCELRCPDFAIFVEEVAG